MSGVQAIYNHMSKLDVIDVGDCENKNKVTLQHVFPYIEDKSILYQEPVFVAVSLGSLAFLNKKFSAIMKFLGNFERSVFYICDAPYAYTLQITHGLSKEESKKLATVVANQTISHQKEVCIRENQEEPQFILHSTLETQEEYKNLYQQLHEMYLDSKLFQNLVEEFSLFYLSRHNNKIFCDKDEALRLSRNYLLSELTAAGILNTKNYKAMLYPGKIDSISGFLTLELSDEIASFYRDFKFVSLRNNRKKKKANKVIKNAA